jgi:ssDNA-specific exonuclease RecJ
VFSDHFDALISKKNLKNKKNYFDAFPNKKHFEKQPQPHS